MHALVLDWLHYDEAIVCKNVRWLNLALFLSVRVLVLAWLCIAFHSFVYDFAALYLPYFSSLFQWLLILAVGFLYSLLGEDLRSGHYLWSEQESQAMPRCRQSRRRECGDDTDLYYKKSHCWVCQLLEWWIAWFEFWFSCALYCLEWVSIHDRNFKKTQRYISDSVVYKILSGSVEFREK